ncbi:MAG: cystathionine beta-synthase [Phycisphaerae bacterium]|nr:cystathionine beta-synthase [Phycisphaerae bacterium]
MRIHESLLDCIGQTPLVRLRRVTAGLKCTVAGKVEYLNPGGSVKDRPALRMLEEAEKAGLLKPGGTIIEPTSGNTGAALAMAAAIKGYRCILVMPDKMAPEKFALLRGYGAEVVTVPTVGANSPESYYSVANRLTEEIHGAFQPNQFANPNNPQAHYDTTGPEIWEQTEGKIDVFVAGMGTGGTITGVARYLKEKNPNIKVVGADPEGSIYTPGSMPKPYQVEGIGEDFLPRTIDLKLVDRAINVSDRDAFLMTRRLAREEGLLVGGSCGAAVCAALEYARDLPAGTLVVVLLPDTGRAYLSKIYNDEWMQAQGYLAVPGVDLTVGDVLDHKGDLPPMITIQASEPVIKAVEKFRKYEISQLPVVNFKGEIIGGLMDTTVMQLIFDHVDIAQKRVADVMNRAFPRLERSAPIDKAYRVLSLGSSAVLVTDGDVPVGVVTKADIINYLSNLHARGANGKPA